jgi:hypothetical protein
MHELAGKQAQPQSRNSPQTAQRKIGASEPPHFKNFMDLQRTIGNRAVQRLLRTDHDDEETATENRLLQAARVKAGSATDGERLFRVPTASGVRSDRYSFSTNCGWIDWSHADPALSTNLIRRVRQASDALRTAGTGATPATGELSGPSMTSTAAGVVLSSASVRARVLRPLSDDEILSVALSIFKKLSLAFETQQEWTDLVGESSFAQEDLPSNLIAFYMAARGYTRDQILQFCATLDRDGSLREFERNHDFVRNRSFSPIGATGGWPTELSNIADAPAGLYEILTISATQGTSAFTFCPLYRVEGTIGETDLFILSVGGTTFTAADNVRVVPTFRAREGTSGRYGHVNFIEVQPQSAADARQFTTHDISTPIYLPSPVLVCLSAP